MAIVCHCEAVRERTIVKAIHRGATTLADVQDSCAAATRCGGCIPAVLELLAAHAGRAAEHAHVLGHAHAHAHAHPCEVGPLRWADSTA